MGINCRQATVITVTCDLCRTTEFLSHQIELEVGGQGAALLHPQHAALAIERLPAGWSVTTTDNNAKRFVCPTCARKQDEQNGMCGGCLVGFPRGTGIHTFKYGCRFQVEVAGRRTQ
jgi:hypothetical protein